MASRLRTRLRASTGLATPSLNIELATAAGGLDPRVTFSRGTQATLTDSTGKITYAPNNLLTNSQDFEATAWLKGVGYNSAISANSATSPTGATDADTLVADNAGGTGAVILGRAVSVTAGISYVLSFYAKKNTLSWMQLYLLNYTTPANGGAFFDLNSGSVGTVSTGFTATTTSAGNGWYRCAIAFTAGSTVTGEMRVYLASANNSTTVNRNGTDSIYIWGAQLEQVTYQTTPGTYNSTTPKNLLGYTQEFDNAAWTKSNSFVQTNFLLRSQELNNAAWGLTGTTVSADVTAAPDGTTTADRLVETTATSAHFVSQASITSVAGAPVTLSFYLKKGSLSTAPDFVQLYLAQAQFSATAYANYNIATGALGTVGAGSTATITPVGNGWYRCTLTATASASSSTATGYLLFCNNSGTAALAPSYTGATTSDVFVWGAQAVQGATAGDYQPTYAAAAAVQYAAPDGTLSADKLVETTSNSSHQLSSGAFVANVPQVYSFYAKAAGRKLVSLTGGGINGLGIFVVWDVNAGTMYTNTGGAGTITSVGNGWYRCSVAFTPNVGNAPTLWIYDDSGNSTYTGDGTSGIYVWGAQLSNSASLDPYVYNPGAAPTSAAYYGPRFDYDPVTLAPKGLLIEEQRTNLLTYSQEFNNAAWTTEGGAITANTAVAPDGTTTADLFTENTANTSHRAGYQSPTTAASAYTFSVYLKYTSRRWVWLRTKDSSNTNRFAWFDIQNGVVGTVQTNLTASITPAGSGWYRCVITVSAAFAGTNLAMVGTALADNTDAYTGDGTSGVLVWGAQVEAGAFATSYIPTVASTVTRSADAAQMLGTNFSSWYNANAGTIVANADTIATTGTRSIMAPSTGGNFLLYISNFNYAGEYDGTNLTLTANQTTQNTAFKAASSYGSGGMSVALNGGTVATGSYNNAFAPIVAVFLGTNAASGALNGHIRSIQYYPTRLTNTQLQVLST